MNWHAIPILLLFFNMQLQAAEASKDSGDAAKTLFMESGITSNNVEHGITQSGSSWALQADFGYKIGSISRIGIWGSSVQFPDASENLNLRGFFDVNFNLTSINSLTLRVDVNRYFQSTSHNGTILSIDDKILGYHLMLEQNSNWEGLGSTATWYGFAKEFGVPWGLIFKPEFGYTQLGASGYQNYFDGKISIGTNVADFLVEASVTSTSSPSQFAGRGNTFFFMTASVRL